MQNPPTEVNGFQTESHKYIPPRDVEHGLYRLESNLNTTKLSIFMYIVFQCAIFQSLQDIFPNLQDFSKPANIFVSLEIAKEIRIEISFFKA